MIRTDSTSLSRSEGLVAEEANVNRNGLTLRRFLHTVVYAPLTAFQRIILEKPGIPDLMEWIPEKDSV